MKSKIRRIMSFILAFSMIFDLFAGNVGEVSAATTKTVSLSGMGSHGTIKIASKTKSGTWWKMHVGSKEAFCMTLGATCHSGNTYESVESYTWTQDTGGEKRGYYAKIFKWYILNCKRSKKSFIMSQALLWSVAEGENSKSQLKDVIKQVKSQTGYYSSRTVDDLYSTIFETTDAFEVKATYWKKTGSSKSYQTLLTVDAEEIITTPPHHLHTHDYYRQRVTVEKKDDLGNPLGGIKFQLDADNIDELYSFSVGDANGTESGSVDSSDDTEFSMVGETRDNGTIAFRMTYYLQSDIEAYYYTDEQLSKMSDADKKAAKKHLTDDLELEQGVDFGADMTKAQAEKLADKTITEQKKNINNGYVLTEIDTSAQPNVFPDSILAKGFAFNLNKDYSWSRNSDGKWPDTLIETPRTYSKAYTTGVINKLKKASVEVIKKDSYSKDGKSHGDAELEGAKYQLYSDAGCTKKAAVYQADGTAKEAGEYEVKDGKFETDYLIAGGKYYLKEINAPTGYTLNGGVREITVDGSKLTLEYTPKAGNTQVDEKPILGKVAIQKYFNEDEPAILNPEAGAKFQVYLKSANSFDKADADYERDEIVTDENGYAVTKDLYFGTYIVHQVSSGPVDTINAADFEVEVTEDGKTYTYPIRNPYFKAYLKIIKKDKNTEKQVLKEGTAYQIYKVKEDGTEEKVVQTFSDGYKNVNVDTFITDATGEIMTVKELRSGTYRIYETDSASGLHITEKYIEVTINSKLDNYTEEIDAEGYKHVTVTVSYVNEETFGKFMIKKTGEQLASWDAKEKKFVFEEKALMGATFKVIADGDIKTQDNQGTNWFDDGDTVATIRTGEGVTFKKDIKGLTGYELAEDDTLTINLPLGKYKVKEVKTIYGYVFPKDNTWNLEFNWKNSKDTFVLNSTKDTDEKGYLTVKNSLADTKINLLKVDSVSMKPIKGVQFGFFTKNDIYNAAGEKIVDADTMLTSITTDEKGNAVCDLKVPVMDEHYMAVAETENAINGTEENSDKEQNFEYTKASGITSLNSGDYYLKELSVSKSYFTDDLEIPVHFEYKDAEKRTISKTVTKKNTQTVTEIDKNSLTGSEEIAGCELQITDKDGNVIITWTSGNKESAKLNEKFDEMGYSNVSTEFNSRGNLVVRGLLNNEEYTLTELRPADGYVTADSITFMVKENQNPASADAASGSAVMVEDTVENMVASGSAFTEAKPVEGTEFTIVSIKNADGTFTDRTDNRVIMLDDTTKVEFSKTDITGEKEIPGCELSIAVSGGAVVEEWTSTKVPHIIENKLVVGETYVLTEKRPADGYVTADSVEFKVEDTGEIQKVEMHDEETHIKLIKLDAGSGQGLAGAKFTVLDAGGKEVMKFISNEDGVDIKGKLAVGKTYTFHEVSAPKGYKTAKDVKYTVKDTAEVQKISVTDEKIPDTPHVPQTGGNSFDLWLMMLGFTLSMGGVWVYRKRFAKRDV